MRRLAGLVTVLLFVAVGGLYVLAMAGVLPSITGPAILDARSIPAAPPSDRVYDPDGLVSADARSDYASRLSRLRARSGQDVVLAVVPALKVPTQSGMDDDASWLMGRWRLANGDETKAVVVLIESDGSRGGAARVFADGWNSLLDDSDTKRIESELQQWVGRGEYTIGSGLCISRIEALAAANRTRGGLSQTAVGLLFAAPPVAGLMVVSLLWWRRGRDAQPAALSPITMVPPDLSPAMASLLLADDVTPAAAAATIVDLAADGKLRFGRDTGGELIAVFPDARPGDESTPGVSGGVDTPEARLVRAMRNLAIRESSPGRLTAKAIRGYAPLFIPGYLRELGSSAVARGWQRQNPLTWTWFWRGFGGVLIGFGALMLIREIGAVLHAVQPRSMAWRIAPLLLWPPAGALMSAVASVLPARTASGASLAVALERVRLDLQGALGAATSVADAVAPEPWRATPDKVVAWSIALGLDEPLMAILRRERSGQPNPDARWVPTWYIAGNRPFDPEVLRADLLALAVPTAGAGVWPLLWARPYRGLVAGRPAVRERLGRIFLRRGPEETRRTRLLRRVLLLAFPAWFLLSSGPDVPSTRDEYVTRGLAFLAMSVAVIDLTWYITRVRRIPRVIRLGVDTVLLTFAGAGIVMGLVYMSGHIPK